MVNEISIDRGLLATSVTSSYQNTYDRAYSAAYNQAGQNSGQDASLPCKSALLLWLLSYALPPSFATCSSALASETRVEISTLRCFYSLAKVGLWNLTVPPSSSSISVPGGLRSASAA